MAWVRDDEIPDRIRVTFIVTTKDHPELAKFLWSLPYMSTSRVVRDILSAAVKSAMAGGDPGQLRQAQVPVEPGRQAGQPTQPQSARPDAPTTNGGSAEEQAAAGADNISSAAAEVIRNFDKMFPS